MPPTRTPDRGHALRVPADHRAAPWEAFNCVPAVPDSMAQIEVAMSVRGVMGICQFCSGGHVDRQH